MMSIRMNQSLPDAALQQLFTHARTHSAWKAEAVTDAILKQVYELAKWAPTAANAAPARILFVRSKTAKEKLLACVSPGNIDKIREASVTAIIAHDMEFHEQLPKLFPHADAKSWFTGNPELIHSTAFRNSRLQGAYLMIAARALGLDCGPMSGFEHDKVDEEFFAGTHYRSNFLCNLGYGEETKLHPRLPRLPFEDACKIV